MRHPFSSLNYQLRYVYLVSRMDKLSQLKLSKLLQFFRVILTPDIAITNTPKPTLLNAPLCVPSKFCEKSESSHTWDTEGSYLDGVRRGEGEVQPRHQPILVRVQRLQPFSVHRCSFQACLADKLQAIKMVVEEQLTHKKSIFINLPSYDGLELLWESTGKCRNCWKLIYCLVGRSRSNISRAMHGGFSFQAVTK